MGDDDHDLTLEIQDNEDEQDGVLFECYNGETMMCLRYVVFEVCDAIICLILYIH